VVICIFLRIFRALRDTLSFSFASSFIDYYTIQWLIPLSLFKGHRYK
jgi:hypothetical protein